VHHSQVPDRITLENLAHVFEFDQDKFEQARLELRASYAALLAGGSIELLQT